jgi:hypothetical protein
MPTPTGTIKASDINIELGRSASAQLSLNDSGVRGLAGVPSGQISYNNLRGKSNLAFSVPPGFYDSTSQDEASYTLAATQVVVWTWTRDKNTNTLGTPSSGGSSQLFTADVSAIGPAFPTTDNRVTYTVYATYNGVQYGPWTLQVTALGSA